MKLLALILLVPILLELCSAVPVTTIDEYGRVYRTSRMGKNRYQQLDDDNEEDADDEDNDDEEDADDEGGSDGIYPPDFAKLFPNPDGRPVGPDSYDSYMDHHPANPQPGKPTHGPAASPGPAASRGPVPQRAPPRNQASGNHPGYARPQYDSPPPQQGSRPSYGQGPPPRRQYSRPPPQQPQYNEGPPPQQGEYDDGPPPQYRSELNTLDEETEPEEGPTGRQLQYYVKPQMQMQRQVGPVYTNRRPVYYNNRRNYQTYVPVPNRRYSTYMPRTKTYPVVPSSRRPMLVRAPMGMNRQAFARHERTSPFSRYSIHSDYNPEYIINPTAMLSRRRFRYHPTQRVPSQRIPLYGGYWPNPAVGHHYQRW